MVFCDFCDFFWSGAPLRESGCRVSKTDGFLRFFFGRVHPLRENKGRVSKTVVFLRFWGSQNCPENCAHDSFCLIRPFFRERKNEQKSPKNVKNWGFLAIFSCSKQPSAGIRLSNVKNCFFLRFFLVGCTFFFLRLPTGQYGPVSQLSRSEERCTGPFNWGEAHCAGEKVKRKIGPFQWKSL